MTQPIVFCDTETDGLHHGRRVWEVAMIRRDDQGERERTFFTGLDLRHSDPQALEIGRFWDRHPAGRKMSGKTSLGPTPGPPVMCKHDAAREVMAWTFGATIVGVGVHFDTETLAGMLRSEGYLPAWHYAIVDVKALMAGYLNARARSAEENAHLRDIDGSNRELDLLRAANCRTVAAPPWKSEELSRACGVEPPTETERHTALGDARWAMRIYDQITGGLS